MNQQYNLGAVADYVEVDTEVTKSTLINRIRGHVPYTVFVMVKLLQFCSIWKRKNGELVLL